MYQLPSYLKTGDCIGIVAPARKISSEEISDAINIFKSWGLNVVLGENIFKSYHQFSGTDKQRAEDFQSMLDNNAVKAVVCARGGYGCVRIIDFLDFSGFENKPKWIVGYSDVTVFHSHIHNNCHSQSIHATMPINMLTDESKSDSIISLYNALFGKDIQYNVQPHLMNKHGDVEGILVGGNLSVLYSLLGSKSDVDTNDKVLFIEDLDEYLYHIDRMMMCLKRAGKLNNLKGLIVGSMNKMNDNIVPFGKNAYDIINDAINEYNYPVCFGFPAGHTNDNRALIIGGEIRMKITETKVTVNQI